MAIAEQPPRESMQLFFPSAAVEAEMVSRFQQTGFAAQCAMLDERGFLTEFRKIFPHFDIENIQHLYAVAGEIHENPKIVEGFTEIHTHDSIHHAIQKARLGPMETIRIDNVPIPNLVTKPDQRFVAPFTRLTMYMLEVEHIQYFSRFPKNSYPLECTVYIAATPYIIHHTYGNGYRMMPRAHMEMQIEWTPDSETRLREHGANIQKSMERSWQREIQSIRHPLPGSFGTGNK